jgi:hypothetical protein
MNNRVLLSCVVSLSTIAIFHVVGEEETGIPLAVKLAKNPPPAEALNRFRQRLRLSGCRHSELRHDPLLGIHRVHLQRRKPVVRQRNHSHAARLLARTQFRNERG